MAQPMPTAAKLAAALCFAIVGWILADYFALTMPDASSVGPIRPGAAVLGLIIGWRVMGPSVGKGYVEAAGSGIKTSVVLGFFALLFLSLKEMLEKSVKQLYSGALDAILDVFVTMGQRSEGLLSLGVIGTMLIGGIIGGLLAESASRRWR